jgi:tRNA threonylcarbamoyladenosine biosynthesis protein TsaE
VNEPWVLSEEQLVDWGLRLGRAAQTPLVVAIRGDLGAGKTTLARAIARGAGVSGPIPSPTFNLLFRYPARAGVEVVHLDLFRLQRPDDVWMLGWAELPAPHELVLIEWPERAEALLPSARWEISLAEGEDPSRRLVRAGALGEVASPAIPGEGG